MTTEDLLKPENQNKYVVKLEKVKRHWTTREDSSDTDVYYALNYDYSKGNPVWQKLGMIVDECDFHVMYFREKSVHTDVLIALAELMKTYKR